MFFFFQAEDGIRDYKVTGVQTCALPISRLIVFWARRSPINFQNLLLAPSSSCSASNPSTPTINATGLLLTVRTDRKSTRLNSSHLVISYAVFCLKKKKKKSTHHNTTPDR